MDQIWKCETVHDINGLGSLFKSSKVKEMYQKNKRLKAKEKKRKLL